MRGSRGVFATVLALTAVLASFGRAQAAEHRTFLSGYATAVLERELDLVGVTVDVRGGHARVRAADLGATPPSVVVAVLTAVEGIDTVEIVDDPPPNPPLLRTLAGEGAWFPRGQLFEPLLADPRWPHFSTTYQRYLDDAELVNVGSANFGETFPIYRGDAFFGGRWEVAVQAGVFAIFDLDAPSKDLINADYFGGIPFGWRRGPVSALVRVFHQSSHLGDEFLLRSRTDRVNLSYEQVDGLLSIDLFEGVRVYGGGGTLFNQEPADLREHSAQWGVELTLPFAGAVRPLVALDAKNREENDWETDVSIRGGLSLASPWSTERRLQLLVEHFDGRSPNGQFFDRRIETVGVGLHVHF